MATSGPNLPGTGVDLTGVGTVAWVNPSRITAEDASISTASIIGSLTSHYLKATNFGFALPAGSVIDGITTEWKRGCTFLAGQFHDFSVMMVKAGTIVGSDYKKAGNWSVLTLTWVSYGGAADLWGTTWTDTDINDSTFGAVFAAQTSASSDSGQNANLDACRITITYHAGAAASTRSPSGGAAYASPMFY